MLQSNCSTKRFKKALNQEYTFMVLGTRNEHYKRQSCKMTPAVP